MGLITMEWRYTYRSARRDGWSRTAALRKFAREMFMGVTYPLRYDHAGQRR
jgi:hypothetical protein